MLSCRADGPKQGQCQLLGRSCMIRGQPGGAFRSLWLSSENKPQVSSGACLAPLGFPGSPPLYLACIAKPLSAAPRGNKLRPSSSAGGRLLPEASTQTRSTLSYAAPAPQSLQCSKGRLFPSWCRHGRPGETKRLAQRDRGSPQHSWEQTPSLTPAVAQSSSRLCASAAVSPAASPLGCLALAGAG